MCPQPGMKAEKRPAVAARDEQVDVVGARHDRDPRVGLAPVPDRQVAVVDLAVAVLERELAEPVTGVHPQVVADVVPSSSPCPAMVRGVLRARARPRNGRTRPRCCGRWCSSPSTMLSRMPSAVVGDVVRHAVRRLGGDHEHRRVARRRSPSRRGRAQTGSSASFSATAVGVLAGVAERALVELARPAAADVEQHQPDGAADRGVGAVARAEALHAAVHPDRRARSARSPPAAAPPCASSPARRSG